MLLANDVRAETTSIARPVITGLRIRLVPTKPNMTGPLETTMRHPRKPWSFKLFLSCCAATSASYSGLCVWWDVFQAEMMLVAVTEWTTPPCSATHSTTVDTNACIALYVSSMSISLDLLLGIDAVITVASKLRKRASRKREMRSVGALFGGVLSEPFGVVDAVVATESGGPSSGWSRSVMSMLERSVGSNGPSCAGARTSCGMYDLSSLRLLTIVKNDSCIDRISHTHETVDSLRGVSGNVSKFITATAAISSLRRRSGSVSRVSIKDDTNKTRIKKAEQNERRADKQLSIFVVKLCLGLLPAVEDMVVLCVRRAKRQLARDYDDCYESVQQCGLVVDRKGVHKVVRAELERRQAIHAHGQDLPQRYVHPEAMCAEQSIRNLTDKSVVAFRRNNWDRREGGSHGVRGIHNTVLVDVTVRCTDK
eukprot:PhM_4_TR10602/c0_g1_i2/m.32660